MFIGRTVPAIILIIAGAICSVGICRNGAEAAPDSTPAVSEDPLIALDYKVRLEGDVLADGRVFETSDGTILIDIEPIAHALSNEFRYERESRIFHMRRAADGTLLSINTATGQFHVNNRAVGKVPNIDQQMPERLLLDLNAVAVLTGTHISLKADENIIDIELDERLKPVFDFELIVNGRRLGLAEPVPRSIGSILLLPLRPIAAELNDTIEIGPGGNSVTVIRAQDSATISLNLSNGLVQVNQQPVGFISEINFADRKTLLLPRSAVELLTGTNIRIEPGTNRVLIDLDSRLSGAIAPQADILEKARREPFTPESLKLVIGNGIINRVEFRSRYRTYNSRLKYETADLPLSADEFRPQFAALEFESLRGFGGTFGDYIASRRELGGVGITRLRGAQIYLPGDKGTWVGLIGRPLSGASRVDNNLSVPTYSGIAAGVRYYDAGKSWEAGLALRSDEGDGNSAVVASGLWHQDGQSSVLGAVSLESDLSLGLFTGGNGAEIDGQGLLSFRARPTQRLNFFSSAHYIGQNFSAFGIDAGDEQDDNVATQADSFIGNVTLGYRPFNRVALGVRARLSQEGLIGDLVRQTHSFGVGATANPFRQGPSFTIDYSHGENKQAGMAKRDFDDLTIRAFHDTRYVRFTGSYAHRRGIIDLDEASFRASTQPYIRELPKGASLSLIGHYSLASTNGDILSRAGGTVTWDSGYLAGSKLRFRAIAGHDETIISEGSVENDTSNSFINASARYRVTRNAVLEAGYRTNFNDNNTVLIALRADFNFNKPRRYSSLVEGRGVLTGRVFHDSNGDGVRSPGEHGVAGAPVRLAKTGLRVTADRNGYFTIRNLPVGIYNIKVDRSRLPLGFMVRRDEDLRPTIADGMVTDIEIPLVVAGQITGIVFSDTNDNGKMDPDETGIEEVTLVLTAEDFREEMVSTLFGQFAFGRLRAGQYRLIAVDASGEPLSGMPPLAITLSQPDNMIKRVRVAVPPAR